MAGQGKEKKQNREEGVKREDLTALLRQLTEQVGRIQADLDSLKAGKGAVAETAPTPDAPDRDHESLSLNDAEIARLGYAFSSPQKVALARLLLTGGEQTAAQLGEQAGLTTGSLYHHLRELIHADVLTQETRNRYSLSERGRQAILALASLTAG